MTPSTPNKGYPDQVIQINITRGSSDTVMVRETQRGTFDLDLELTDNPETVVNNVGRKLVAKKPFLQALQNSKSLKIQMFFDVYKYLSINVTMYFCKVFNHGICTNFTALSLNTEENRFAIPLDFEFIKQSVCPYYLHEDLNVTIEHNKP